MGEFSTKKGVQERDIVCMYVNMNMRCVCVCSASGSFLPILAILLLPLE